MTNHSIPGLKKTLVFSVILLTACNNDMPLFLPDRQDVHFECDMDPHRQGCERQMDYQEHFRWIKHPEK